MSKTMEEFNNELDEITVSPKKKNPSELQQNPIDILDPERNTKDKESANSAWDIAEAPGSGASEGRGSHNWGTNDNGAPRRNS